MTFTTLLPITDRNNGNLSSGSRALPGNINAAALRIDCTTGIIGTPFQGFTHPFNNSSMKITLVTAFSWDGGVTFPESASTSAVGVPSGLNFNGTRVYAPMFSRGVPFDSTLGGRPTHYQATLTITGGPITFGASLEES